MTPTPYKTSTVNYQAAQAAGAQGPGLGWHGQGDYYPPQPSGGSTVNYAGMRAAGIEGPGLGWHGPGDYYSPQLQGDSPTSAIQSPAGPSPEEIAAQEAAALQAQLEEQARQQQAAIDEIYNPLYKSLTDQAGLLESQQPGVMSEIDAMIGTSRQAVDRSKASGEAGLSYAQDTAATRKEDALSAARRLYNELIMGGKQRYGGASSAGEAYGALAGRELMRNQGDIGRGYEDSMKQIQMQRASLSDQYLNATQQLELQRTQLITQAQRDFQAKIQEINSRKDELDSAKATMNLEALQALRNQINEINFTLAQNKLSLDTQAQQALGALDTAANNLSQYQTSFSPNMTPQTSLTPQDNYGGNLQVGYGPDGTTLIGSRNGNLVYTKNGWMDRNSLRR